jgi:copper chaperone
MTIFVPDMSCEHCKRTLEKALGKVDKITGIKVHLESRTITLEGGATWETVASAIREAGYTPEKR